MNGPFSTAEDFSYYDRCIPSLPCAEGSSGEKRFPCLRRKRSPATETIDRAKKLRIYAREDVEYAWLLNPTLRTLEVLSLQSQRWTLVATYENDAKARAEPFDAIELELDALRI